MSLKVNFEFCEASPHHALVYNLILHRLDIYRAYSYFLYKPSDHYGFVGYNVHVTDDYFIHKNPLIPANTIGGLMDLNVQFLDCRDSDYCKKNDPVTKRILKNIHTEYLNDKRYSIKLKGT